MRLLSLVVVVLLAGCNTDEVLHGARLPLTVSQPCRSQDAVEAAKYRVTIFGDGEQFDRQELTALPSSLVVPPTGRVTFEIVALDSAGEVVGRGFSAPLEEPRPTDGTEALTFSVWPTGRFIKLCNELMIPRSGHSVVELADGSLAIAGGLDPAGRTIASIERATVPGAVEHVGEIEIRAQGMTYPLPRAWHAATSTGNGQFVLIGGEQTNQNGVSAILSTVVVVDPPSGFQLGAIPPQVPAWSPRSHALAVRSGTIVFVAGGMTRTATSTAPSTLVDRLDLQINRFLDPVTLPFALENSAPTVSADVVLLAGGLEQGQPSAKAVVWAGGQVSTPMLQMARSAAGSASVGTGRAFVAGGVGQGNTVLGTTEWLTASGATAGALIEPRSKPCVVGLDPHRALVFGGKAVGGASAAAEIVSDDGTVVSLAFDGPGRFDHTCTPLSWGPVVIAGGSDGARPLGDVWAFVP